MEPKAYWVGFNLVKGIGAVRLQGLLNAFGDLESAWQAPAEQLRASGLPERIVQTALQVRRQVDLQQIWDSIQAKQIRVWTWQDEDYPRLLKEIDQPPPVLYGRGDVVAEDDWSVAIVGTRKVSSYGRQVAEEVASFLASRGITVVSGLARGVDGIAHQAALRAGGRTLAVLGSGVDQVYPPEHRKLAEEISAQGAVLSDYPPGTPPDGVNFPPRNRIVSGLSRATVIIEAGETSGALITASFAANQGRDVFAVPGPIHAPQSKGPNKLIRDGARPLLNPADVLEVFDLEQAQVRQAARKAIPADELEARLSEALGYEPLHIDEISNRVSMPIEKVSATLALMELKGMVRHLGSMNYVTVREDPGGYWTEPHG